MGDAGDRMDRAGRYVLGLMDEDERERAERDLEIDPAFREAMVLIAERMHVFDKVKPETSGPAVVDQDPWRAIKQRIDTMPQMRSADTHLLPVQPGLASDEVPGGGASPGPSAVQKPDNADKPTTFGRRRTDAFNVPVTVQESRVKPMWLDASRRTMAIKLVIALIVAFALGYVIGRM